MGKHPAKEGKAARKASRPKLTKMPKPKIAKVKAPKPKAAKAKIARPLTAKAATTSAPAAAVLDRLFGVVTARRTADPALSHSARLLGRGLPKVAQKFGEEAVECLIEAVGGNKPALVAESADVLYHLLVMWVAAGVTPDQVWAELERREGMSGVAEKAARARPALAQALGTTKIP